MNRKQLLVYGLVCVVALILIIGAIGFFSRSKDKADDVAGNTSSIEKTEQQSEPKKTQAKRPAASAPTSSSAQATPAPAAASNSSKLVNTGPGDEVLRLFVVSSLAATAASYGYQQRKMRSL